MMAKHIPLTRADIKETSVQKGVLRAWNNTNPLRHGSSDHRLLQKNQKSKAFIPYVSNACWTYTITIKYEYKLNTKI